MKISYNWLRQYISCDVQPDKVAELLTGCGLEVENQETYHSVKGGLRGVVIGEVLTCGKHPNSDHLSLTTVDIGAAEPLRIVCGAPNVAAGQKVAVATIGTTLSFNDKEITLQRTKIRGEVSEGMICAEDELGLGTSHEGIMVLADDARPGTPAATWFGIEEDVVFTIGLTPNRVDAASHLGVARDLAAVINNYGRTDVDESPAARLVFPDVSAFHEPAVTPVIGVAIEDTGACPRYSGLTLSGIKVAESPAWLKNRLQSVGLRPINNIVDITNFVLMETGQPLHAFDAGKITGNKVVVKKYPEGTRFKTLDDVERSLSAADLMICNVDEPMCIAGVFGGIGSGVTSETTSVFLESACFDPAHVRKTSKSHGLQTDASFRFERGSDIGITLYALKRAAILITEIAGGEISSGIVDVYPNPRQPAVVDLSPSRAESLIGKKIPARVIENILTDLDIRILDVLHSAPVADSPDQCSENITGYRLQIPFSKVDVTREADVIEEILRIYGYNNIEIKQQVNSALSWSTYPDPVRVQSKVSDFLVANGFLEIMTNSLTRSAYHDGNHEFPLEKSVKILNPLSRDLDVMRQTLLFGALESLTYNQNRQSADLKLFEFGRVFELGGSANDPVSGYHEEKHLSIIVTGRKEAETWNTINNPSDFFELKGFVNSILRILAINPGIFETISSGSPLFTSGLLYRHRNREVAMMGITAPGYLKQFDIAQPVYYAEINWDLVFSLISGKPEMYREMPRYPEVRRDLALLVDREVTFAAIEKIAWATERKILRRVGLFDVYEGDKIETGKKSYAISFILQDENRTLTDKEIEKTMDRLIRSLTEGLDARIR